MKYRDYYITFHWYRQFDKYTIEHNGKIIGFELQEEAKQFIDDLYK